MKNFKVKGSYGVYDCYKAIRKHNWFNIGRPVTEKEFYAIIRGINNLIAEEIAKGETIVFPEKMGKLELRKYQVGAYIKDGKLKVTYPIDWYATNKLWEKDEEARKNKTLLRHSNQWVYHVKYLITGATFENKTFYLFTLNSFIKQKLSMNIKQNKVDTLYG